MPSASRPFSTTSPVYPYHLPKLHKSGRMEKKLAAATIAALGVGYTVSTLRSSSRSSHFSADDTTSFSSSSSPYSSSSSSASTTSSTSRQRQHTYSSSPGGYSQQKQRELAMLDAYGSGETLAELEAAVNAYAALQAERPLQGRK